jgi:3',5'-cyclic AMP phosphodiesterase CpdA
MQIAHISDLHVVGEAGPVGLLRKDSVERARALIRDLNDFAPSLDLVVITGDNVNDARADEYEALAGLLGLLDVPFVVIPGNHDDRRLLRRVAPHQPYAHSTLLYHRRELGKVRIFALDTLSEGEIGGRLLSDQLDWLATELAQPFAGQTLVAMHHPPCKPRLGRLDGATLLEGTERLQALLDGQERPVTILCGHMHRPFTAFLGRSVISAASSIAFEFALRLDAPDEPPTQDAPFHYVIHALSEHGGHTMHRWTPTL